MLKLSFRYTRNLFIRVEGIITGRRRRSYSVAWVACYTAVALIQ
jgi:hypothetical protein